MTVDAAIDRVLARCSDAQLEALARAWEERDEVAPLHGAQPGARNAVKHLRAAWLAEPALTGRGVAVALRCGARARKSAQETACRPVWTGPGAKGEQRLTSAELVGVVASATRSVLVVSYATYTLPEVADALRDALERGCSVDAVFESGEDSGGGYSGPSTPFAAVDGIVRWRWPANKRGQGAALHAKLLVADGRRALVGSANLTHRALHANLEAGVLVQDPVVAGAFEEHVRRLMADGTLERCT